MDPEAAVTVTESSSLYVQILSHPFVWGLLLGLLFFLFSAWSHFKTKRELRRYRKHLSDKLELEARQYEVLRQEKEMLMKENENLRLRIGLFNEKPDQKLVRDLEVFSRAEKRMILQAPGFAGAWENAKAAAIEELTAEDHGRSLPKRLFSRLFGTGSTLVGPDGKSLLMDGTAPHENPQAQEAAPGQQAPPAEKPNA